MYLIHFFKRTTSMAFSIKLLYRNGAKRHTDKTNKMHYCQQKQINNMRMTRKLHGPTRAQTSNIYSDF